MTGGPPVAAAQPVQALGDPDRPTRRLTGLRPSAVRNVRLLDGTLVDLHLRAGQIADPEPAGERAGDAADQPIDATGWRLLPAAAEPHAHLDKAFTLDRTSLDGENSLRLAIDRWRAIVPQLDRDNIARRARSALGPYVANGVTALRTHVDGLADDDPLRGVDALCAVREQVRGSIDVQVCLLAGQQTSDDLVREAVARGIDVIGGCPHLTEDPVAETTRLLDLAEATGLPVDLHTDEQTNLDGLDVVDLAEQVIARGMQGRVAASHCVRLGLLEGRPLTDVLDLLRRAELGVITLPITNLYLQGRRPSGPMLRGLPPLRELLDAGVLLAAGGDNVRDPFNPAGRADPFETASLLIVSAQLTPREALYAVTDAARAVMGLPAADAQPGAPADFILVPDLDPVEFLSGRATSKVVVHRGQIVADTRISTSLEPF